MIVQVVEILWSKATRGAPRSNERACLPRAFAIGSSVAECLIQHHRMAEWKDFTPELSKTENLSAIPRSVGVLRLVPKSDGAFAIGVFGTPDSGQPQRRAIQNAVHLLPGQWARIVLNARHTSYSGQHYSETTFNVASNVRTNRFLVGSPDHDLDLKADLF